MIHSDNCMFINEDAEVITKIKSELPGNDELQKISLFFKAISDETRIKILFLLMHGEMCVCDISELLDMTISAISHQLRVLKQAGLVKSRKEGKNVYYSVSDHHVEIMFKNATEHVAEE